MERLKLFQSPEGYHVFPYQVIPDKENPGFSIKDPAVIINERWLVRAGPKVKSFTFPDADDRLLTAHCDKEGFIQSFTLADGVEIKNPEIRNNHGNNFWGHAYRVKKIPRKEG